MKKRSYQQNAKILQNKKRRKNIINSTGGGNSLQGKNERDNSYLKYWLNPQLSK